jgi:hypothetical protein
MLKKLINWFKYKNYEKPKLVWIIWDDSPPALADKGYALGEYRGKVKCSTRKDKDADWWEWLPASCVIERDEYGDWCDECGAPQMVLPNGEHVCGRQNEAN